VSTSIFSKSLSNLLLTVYQGAPRTAHRAPRTAHRAPRTAHRAPRTAHRAWRSIDAELD